mmetsp:Transcript_37221/g.93563  ORF Transcript_37221/g.93563 Transcript_37221/m.93563 type:complete len:166 (+) Transcript_37221:60-557(+)|eukprot:jgi/Tetstr1/440625/TSEL_028935.t1
MMLPRPASLLPGVVDHAFSWEEVRAATEDGSEAALATLGRFQADIDRYRAFKATVLESYASMEDYVRVTIFGYQAIAADNRMCASKERGPGERELIWRRNDFPYALQEGIHHDVIWCRTALSAQEIDEACRERYPDCECATFVNPAALASIPSLWHAHVMWRKRG